jgi:hypothetical protein
VTDEPLRSIGYALLQAAKDLGHDVMLVEILPRATNGAEPPPLVAQLMTHADVVLCIGTNDRARLSGVILEDEKVMGTIHVAFGDNKSMGGSVGVASHLDGLVKQPSVWFDDHKIMDAGRLLDVE